MGFTRSQAKALGIPWGSDQPKARRGVRNRTEARFAREVLDVMVAAGEIDGYEFEGVKLLIARAGGDTKAAFYTIDFFAWKGRTFTGFEVKGFWRESARLRIKVAAERHPWIRFVAVRHVEGRWVYEEF